MFSGDSTVSYVGDNTVGNNPVKLLENTSKKEELSGHDIESLEKAHERRIRRQTRNLKRGL